jgi:hypothetical protein
MALARDGGSAEGIFALDLAGEIEQDAESGEG